MTRSEVVSLLEGGKWARKPYARQFTMVRCGKKEQSVPCCEGEGRPLRVYVRDNFTGFGASPQCAAIQAVCLALIVIPSALVFLSHYTTWGFKSCFVKIKAEDSHFCVDPRPLPLYWKEPLKFKGLLRSQLSLEASVDLQLLDALPRGMNCKEIVAWASANNATYPLKSEFCV
ncbi:hypothetical protein CR513_08624, partial [Mucuna pruriens]